LKTALNVKPQLELPARPTSMWPTDVWGFLTLGWLLLIHLTALVGLILRPLPGWNVFGVFVLLSFLGGTSTVICYHRELAHRSLTLHPVVRAVMIFLAMLNGAAPPGSWVPTHRLHHAETDTPDDPSSPVWRGMWFAHVAWHWQADNGLREPYARDLARFSLGTWNRLLIPMFAIAYFGGALWSLTAFFWLGAIRMTFAFHATSLINSACHTEPGIELGEDSSRNLWWVGVTIFFLGENWHRNHHLFPRSARMGLRWWQPDVGYWLICGLARLGLASEVQSAGKA